MKQNTNYDALSNVVKEWSLPTEMTSKDTQVSHSHEQVEGRRERRSDDVEEEKSERAGGSQCQHIQTGFSSEVQFSRFLDSKMHYSRKIHDP